MTKEDQVAFKDWIDNRTDIFSCWCAKEGFLAANPYKDKRIAALEKEVNDLRKLRDIILSNRYLADDGYSNLVNVAKAIKEGDADA